MAIHGIFSSYFGDIEYDVGKTTPWNQSFFDTEYVLDVGGTFRTRRFMVAWSASFPDVKAGYYSVTPSTPDFFSGGSALWRETSFNKALEAWDYDDDDWVVFVDCSEGLCVNDNFPLTNGDIGAAGNPGDIASLEDLAAFYAAPGTGDNQNPFQVYLEREIAAISDFSDALYLPVYAFTRNSFPWVNEYIIDQSLEDALDANPAPDYLGRPEEEWRFLNRSRTVNAYDFYVFAGWSPRAFKVSTLKDPDFDWFVIDTFTEELSDLPFAASQYGTATFGDSLYSTALPTNGLSLITYAYARWSRDPERIDIETRLPLTEDDDQGFVLRSYISQVRPVTGLALDWGDPDVGERAHPAHPDATPDPGIFEFQKEFAPSFDRAFRNFDQYIPDGTPLWDDWSDTLSSPVYQTLLRLNLRDGVAFLSEEYGPVPWDFLTGQTSITALEEQLRLDYTFNNQSPLGSA